MKKRKKSNIIFTVLSLMIIALLVSLPFIIEDRKEDREAVKIVSSVAETGSISKTLSGTGTLTAQDAEDVILPANVEITRYAVDNGDVVEEGAALAYVDRVSVLQAIASCQETLEYIEEEMDAVSRNAASEEVTAPAKGIVKAVFAEDGDDVRQVMLEHGALAVLEIEGKEWKAQAYTGTVFHTAISEGKTVYTGTTLFYLADTTDSSAYELLAQQHREYEDIMQTLAVLYQDGVISAPCAGAISGIDVDAAAKLQAEYNRRFGLAETIAYSVPVENNKVMDDPGNEYSGTVIKISSVNGNDVQYQSLPNQVVIGADMSFKDISYYSNFAYGISENAEKKYLDSDVTCVQNINDAGWEPYNNIEKDDVFLLVNSTDISGSGSSKTYAILLGNIPSQKSDPVNPVNPDNNKGNDMNGMGNMSGFSGMGGSSFTSGTGGEEFVMYSSDGTVCMSVTPQETISISITVDELDVLSVQKGSEAKLTIDAFPGREYAGTVTDLSRKATNSGGNSKYTAEITFDREDTMLPGMNASSLITVSTAENVLMLPAKSLTEDGLRTLVYTTYDEKTGLLGGEKEVTTGVSDGENVQILSGISEGDTVYYAYEDSIELESLFGGMPGAPGGFGGFTGGGPSGGGPGGGFSGGPGRD